MRGGPRAWVTVGAVLAVGVALGWWAASQARTPQQQAALAAPPDPSVIAVPLEQRQLVRTLALTCTVGTSFRTTVAPSVTGAEDGLSAVVTALPLATGDDVTEGTAVVEVAARPVIALQGDLPFFRDLRPGTRGPDVRQLQQSLARLDLLDEGAVDGDLGPSTSAAVDELYDRLGYDAPQTSEEAPRLLRDARSALAAAQEAQSTERATGGVSPETAAAAAAARQQLDDLVATEGVMAARSELLAVPLLPGSLIGSPPPLGTDLQPDQLGVAAGEARLRCPLAPGSDPVTVSAEVQVDVEGQALVGTVESTTAPGQEQDAAASPDAPDGTEGEVVIAVDDVPESGTYSAHVVLEKGPPDSLVAPASALWERRGATVLSVRLQDGSVRTVQVETGFELDGEVAVVGEDLGAGDEVVVSEAGRGPGS